VTRRPSPGLIVGAVLVAGVVFTALLSFVWTPYDATEVQVADRLLSPGAHHWLGTDRLGRDVVSQLMVGSRTTLTVGLVASGIGAVLGTPIGVLASMGPRWLDRTVMLGNDLLLAFPGLLLAAMLAAVYGAGTGPAMVAIGLSTLPSFARLARAGTMQVVTTDYVRAALVAGRGSWWNARRHVWPNIAGLVTVQISLSFAIAVVAEAGLSYLGLGTAPPTPSWGRMLQDSQELISAAPLLVLWPAAAIALAVLGLNLLGDGLRDLFDPRLERR